MPEQFLGHLYINPHRPQVGGQRVAKIMPSDLFANDAGPFEGRTDASLQQAVRAEWLSAVEPIRMHQNPHTAVPTSTPPNQP